MKLVHWLDGFIFRGMKGLLAHFLFLTFFTGSYKGFAQDSLPKFTVMISPALFTPVSVALQGGVQYRLNKKWSMLMEAAYPTFYPDNSFEEITYWRSGVELKLHAPKKEVRGRYYAIQANYLYRQLIQNDEGTVQRQDGVYRYDAATIHSPVLSLALKIGVELFSKNRKKFADVFLGAGARRLFNEYEAKNLRLTSLDPPGESFGWLLPDEGWTYDYPLTRFHFTAGVRFGWRL